VAIYRRVDNDASAHSIIGVKKYPDGKKSRELAEALVNVAQLATPDAVKSMMDHHRDGRTWINAHLPLVDTKTLDDWKQVIGLTNHRAAPYDCDGNEPVCCCCLTEATSVPFDKWTSAKRLPLYTVNATCTVHAECVSKVPSETCRCTTLFCAECAAQLCLTH